MAITSREAYQCLRDAALGVAPLELLAQRAGQVEVGIDGWRLGLLLDNEGLACCNACLSPDGRQASLDSWQRYGTNPADHLSLWERQQLERMLATRAAQTP